TGIGAVTPVGTGKAELWAALLAGRSGFSPVESFDTRAHTVHRGAEVKGFRPAAHVRRLDPAGIGRASQLAIAAAWLALADAGIDPADAAVVSPERAGVAMGTTSGEPREIERLDDCLLASRPEEVGPWFADLYPCHVLASHVAAEVGFAGPNTVIPTPCPAGNY